jgi:hypothetical protein
MNAASLIVLWVSITSLLLNNQFAVTLNEYIKDVILKRKGDANLYTPRTKQIDQVFQEFSINCAENEY